jgi:hypothetical protein
LGERGLQVRSSNFWTVKRIQGISKPKRNGKTKLDSESGWSDWSSCNHVRTPLPVCCGPLTKGTNTLTQFSNSNTQTDWERLERMASKDGWGPCSISIFIYLPPKGRAKGRDKWMQLLRYWSQ